MYGALPALHHVFNERGVAAIFLRSRVILIFPEN